jgi:hypothetical protein
METKPPKKEGLPRAQQPLKENKTSLNVSDPASDGKSVPFVDPWLEARIHYLAAEVTSLKAGPIALRFLNLAKARHHQYRACGGPRLRYLAWCALDIVAQPLGRSREQVPQQADPSLTISANRGGK